jgi:hypothetical protein
VRVLVAYEEACRAYRDALARAIKDHRPRFVVLGADPRGLGGALESFAPHAVVSSRPSSDCPAGARRGAAVRVAHAVGRLAVGRRTEGERSP